MKNLLITAMCACLAFTITAATAAETDIPGTNGVPDLTKGGELTRINKRWVGPVGIFCGTWRPRGQKMEDVRQLQVLDIAKGSPADGVLEIGDVILGADGSGAKTVPHFAGAAWAMLPIADAITEAEARNPALLNLLIWRPAIKPQIDVKNIGKKDDKNPKKNTAGTKVDGKIITVSIKLTYQGRYADTAPYDCEKSKRILRNGIKALYEANHCGSNGFEILCLLAADDPTNPDNDKYQAKAKEWAHAMILPADAGNERGLDGAWNNAAKLIVLAEYYMKTKDEAIFPTLMKRAEFHARGVSWFGTTGHRFAELQPDGSFGGRIAGYGPINCSGALGFLGLSLAKKAGVKSSVVDATIERQRIYFGHFAFRGGIGYGEHPYGIGGGPSDNNGKHTMSAFALGLQEGEKQKVDKAKYFFGTSTLSPYSIRQYAHGGSYFGQVWHPLGAAQLGPKAANLQFREIRWHLDLKRRWDNLRIYDSSGNGYNDFGPGATALLFYALPLRNLYITGRDQNKSLQLSDTEFNELVATKNFDASKATTKELIAALSRSGGILRSEASKELANRVKATPDATEWSSLIDQLLAMTTDEKLGPTGRTGACKALVDIKDRNSTSTAELKNVEIAKIMAALLKDTDAYIRFGAVRVLQKLPPEIVRPHANEIIDAIIATDRPTFPLDEEDPLQWAHGQMCALLAENVLKHGADGVDRKKLVAAIPSMLKTPVGAARNVAARALDTLTFEETLVIADSIVECIRIPAPADAMFDGGGEHSLNILAKHLFEEALPLGFAYMPGEVMKRKLHHKFGQAALTLQSSRELAQSLGDLMLVQATCDAEQVLRELKKAAAPKQLNQLKDIHAVKATSPTLTLPTSKTELVVDATNYALRGENDTTYTWRKVYGAGKVNFTPNGSGQSKTTTVEFTDKKPGKYRFAVTMSDRLGYNELTAIVDVTLTDKSGKLPANKPPQATSQSLAAVPGLPTTVTLSGTDPDGDDLGYVVTKHPAHGRLSGIGSNVVYTANFGYNGTDQFTFDAVDGQGKTAAGTIQIKVSDNDVGVAIYEGFDYPAGPVIDQTNDKSFGFSEPWKKSDGKPAPSSFLVDRAPLKQLGNNLSFSYPSLPSTGGKLTKGERHRHCSRALDPKVLAAHKLLNNGSELWFSLVVEKGSINFGLGGAETDIGFKIKDNKIYASYNGETAGTARNPYTRSINLRFPDKMPNMIIGHCVWGKTDTDPDTLKIYRVFDAPEFGPLVLEEPVCVLTEQIAQEKINTIKLHTEVTVDEIRIGPTLNSVMVGTKPLDTKMSK